MLTRRSLLLGAGGLAGCALLPSRRPAFAAVSADWSSHGCNLNQDRYNALELGLTPERVRSLEPAWTFNAGAGVTTTPAVVGNRVYIGGWDGRVHALDRDTGEVAWSTATGTRDYPPDRTLGVFASIAAAGDRLFVASDRLMALDRKTGKILWERTVGDPAHSREYFWAPPIVHGGRVYAGTSAGSETVSRGQVVCLDAATGELLWNFYTVAENVSGGSLFAAPALDPAAGLLWIATGNPFHEQPGPMQHSDSLVALDAKSGKLVFADQVHEHDIQNLDLNCPPVLVGKGRDGRRRIVVGGKDGLRCWDRDSLDRLWHRQLTPPIPFGSDEALATSGPEAGPLAVAKGVAFFASNDHVNENAVLAAVDLVSGNLLWRQPLPAYQFGPLSVAAGVVYIGTVDGHLRAWNTASGELLWTSPAASPIAGGPAIAHGMVFVGTGAGMFLPGESLLAFRAGGSR